MTDSPDKIQWHPAFCAAAGLELQENIDSLELTAEYNLSKAYCKRVQEQTSSYMKN